MEFKNYLLDLIERDMYKTSHKYAICVYLESNILRELLSEIKIKNGRGVVTKILPELNVGYRTFICWISKQNPIPIHSLYEFLLKWKEYCAKSQDEFEKMWDFIYQDVKYYSQNSSPRINLPKEFSKELAYLIGFMLADGHIKRERNENLGVSEFSISMTDEHELFVKQLQTQVYSLFKTKGNMYKESKENCYVLRITSKPIHRFLNRIVEFPEGRKTGYVKVPKIIDNLDQNAKAYFIRGFFDGEGSVGVTSKNPYLEIGQASYDNRPAQILIWIKEELFKRNMTFSLLKTSNEDFWRLRTASKPAIDNFYKQIGSNHPKKINKFKEVGLFQYGNYQDRARSAWLPFDGRNRQETVL